MLKIEKQKDYSDFLHVDADFRSLQMCLAMADEGLNKNGIDKVSYDIYQDEAMTLRSTGVEIKDIDWAKMKMGNNDAHSVTATNVFIKPTGRCVIKIVDNYTGEEFMFGEDQKIKIKRNGNEMEILGKDFKEDDEYIK
ncbi:MAG: hypothetical protein HUJ68_11725 [Clostridia bacterium]|nr:hypothetical protein [Clostridia bacterium]